MTRADDPRWQAIADATGSHPFDIAGCYDWVYQHARQHDWSTVHLDREALARTSRLPRAEIDRILASLALSRLIRDGMLVAVTGAANRKRKQRQRQKLELLSGGRP